MRDSITRVLDHCDWRVIHANVETSTWSELERALARAAVFTPSLDTLGINTVDHNAICETMDNQFWSYSTSAWEGIARQQ